MKPIRKFSKKKYKLMHKELEDGMHIGTFNYDDAYGFKNFLKYKHPNKNIVITWSGSYPYIYPKGRYFVYQEM